VDHPAGTYLPALVGQRETRLSARPGDDETAAFYSGFATFVARLTTELESLQEGLAEVRTDVDEAQQAPSLRERALDARVNEITAQVQKLRSDVSRVLAQQAEAARMRRFSD
jgi:hypothetical protein